MSTVTYIPKGIQSYGFKTVKMEQSPPIRKTASTRPQIEFVVFFSRPSRSVKINSIDLGAPFYKFVWLQ